MSSCSISPKVNPSRCDAAMKPATGETKADRRLVLAARQLVARPRSLFSSSCSLLTTGFPFSVRPPPLNVRLFASGSRRQQDPDRRGYTRFSFPSRTPGPEIASHAVKTESSFLPPIVSEFRPLALTEIRSVGRSTQPPLFAGNRVSQSKLDR